MNHPDRLRPRPTNTPRQHWSLMVIMVLLFILVSCRRSPQEEIRTSPAFVPPTALPEIPTATTTLQLRPTRALSPGPTASLETAPTPCPYRYFFLPSPPSCPDGEPLASFAAEQPFEGGVMIWFEATESIYVFYKNGQWRRFDDTWSETQVQSDPAFTPPAERFQPIRGFGKVWRENTDVREQLGWALSPELAFDSMMQHQGPVFDGDRVLFLRTFNGQVFALTSHGQDKGDWVIAAS